MKWNGHWVGCLLAIASLWFGLFVPVASAQDASGTASPVLGEPIRSISREEARRQIAEHYAFEPPQQQGGVVIASMIGDFRTLNPILAVDGNSFAAIQYVFDSLIGSSPIDGSPMPLGLADRWEIAPDGVTYTFHLSQRATWHDGIDFTADDVVFSFDAIADDTTGAGYTSVFRENVASYRAVDPDTVEVTSNGINANFLFNLGCMPIVAEHVWEAVPRDQWGSDPGSTGQDPSRVVGTGPFVFQEWVPGERITYRRNDAYHDVVPTIDTYIFRIFLDPEAQFNAALTGEVDYTFPAPEQIEVVAQTEGMALVSFSTFSFMYYVPNLDPAKTGLFQDRAVRQALYYALDREAIIRDLALGQAELPQDMHPSISIAYAPEKMTVAYTYDPEKARQLLAQAGWTDTDGDGVVDREGIAFRFKLSYGAGDLTQDQLVAYLQDAWKGVGIAMTPDPIEFNVLITMLDETHDFEMALLANGADPTGDTSVLYGCAYYEGGLNPGRYCNPQVDELLARARRELDTERRMDLIAQADALLWEDQPVGLISFTKGTIGYSTRLHNYFPGPFGSAGLEYVWVEQ